MTDKKQRHGGAVASAILGSLFLLPIVQVLTGGIAIYVGYKAYRDISQQPERYSGKLLAMAGMVLGSLGILFFTSFIVQQTLG